MSSEGEKWIDIPTGQLAAINNITIEECAVALEHDAVRSDAIAHDENDFLGVRLAAEQSAKIKRRCATLLRCMKK